MFLFYVQLVFAVFLQVAALVLALVAGVKLSEGDGENMVIDLVLAGLVSASALALFVHGWTGL